MATPTPISFADLLRRYRRAAGMSQEALAERAGLSRRAVSDLERASSRVPRKDTVELLAEALELADQERALFIATARRQQLYSAAALDVPTSPHHAARGVPAKRGQELAQPGGRVLLFSTQSSDHGRIDRLQERGEAWEREDGDGPVMLAPSGGRPNDAALLLPPPEHFVGRRADLTWVRQRLRAGGSSAITALGGLGGIGKTTLAAVAIHRLQQEEPDCFPDGTAVVLCQGLTDGSEVLRRVLRRFDTVRRAPEVSDLEQLVDVAQTTLAGKAALVVLDNVEPALPITQVIAPLRAAGLTVLVTARQRLPTSAVPGGASRQLELLRPEEALTLFTRALGRTVDPVVDVEGEPGTSSPSLTEEERAAAQAIVEALGRHTLAVKLMGYYAGSEQRDLAALAHELADPARVLELPGEDETPEAVRRSFKLSLDSLPDEARRLFAGLGAFATAECGRHAALALGASLGLLRPEDSLHLLLVRALMEPYQRMDLPPDSDRERLRLHPLLRALSEELFCRWPADEQEAAALSVAQYMAKYTQTQQTSLAVLATDEGNALGALEWAQAQGHSKLVANLTYGLRKFWVYRRPHRAVVRYLAWGVAAAEAHLATLLPASAEHSDPDAGSGQSQDSEEQSVWLRHLLVLRLAYVDCQYSLGHVQAALSEARQSLEHFHRLGDRRGEFDALLSIAATVQCRSQFHKATHYYEQALAIAKDLGDRPCELKALQMLGTNYCYRGEPGVALSYFEVALALNQELRDRDEEAGNLSGLGWIAELYGQLAVADDHFRKFLAFSQEVESPTEESLAWLQRGELAILLGNFDDAREYIRRALAINRQVGSPWVEAHSSLVLGLAALRTGQLVHAVDYFQNALTLAEKMECPGWVGRAQGLLGAVALQRGEVEAPATLLEESLAQAQAAGAAREEAEAQLWIGQLAELQGDLAGAEGAYRSSLAVAKPRELGPEIAAAELALGRLLAERLDRQAEGCQLLHVALRRFTSMGMPEAEAAHAALQRLGC